MEYLRDWFTHGKNLPSLNVHGFGQNICDTYRSGQVRSGSWSLQDWSRARMWKLEGMQKQLFQSEEVKPEFALGIIQPPHTPKKNLVIASALINTDCDIPWTAHKSHLWLFPYYIGRARLSTEYQRRCTLVRCTLVRCTLVRCTLVTNRFTGSKE